MSAGGVGPNGSLLGGVVAAGPVGAETVAGARAPDGNGAVAPA